MFTGPVLLFGQVPHISFTPDSPYNPICSLLQIENILPLSGSCTDCFGGATYYDCLSTLRLKALAQPELGGLANLHWTREEATGFSGYLSLSRYCCVAASVMFLPTHTFFFRNTYLRLSNRCVPPFYTRKLTYVLAT